MDQLHTAQRQLQVQEAALQARQSQDRADQARQSADLTQADAATAALQAQQAQVTGQLAAAVAAQQAAQAEAAAAAVARAPKTTSEDTTTATVATVAAVLVGPAVDRRAGRHGLGLERRPVPDLPDPALNAFLTCVVQAESGGDYSIVSPNGVYMGAFQFASPPGTRPHRRPDSRLLVGVPPNEATKAEQDTVAVALYALDGEQPWLGDRCS